MFGMYAEREGQLYLENESWCVNNSQVGTVGISASEGRTFGSGMSIVFSPALFEGVDFSQYCPLRLLKDEQLQLQGS